MQTKPLLIATLVIPLLLISCGRDDQESPLVTGTSEEKQTIEPGDPAKIMEESAPAAGMAPAPETPPMESAPAAPTVEPDPAMAPATPPSAPEKSGY